ncbi:Hypothetical predicted protein, partial [Olea europaea subsp. europaea]
QQRLTLLLVIAATASDAAAVAGSCRLDSDDFRRRCKRGDGRRPKVGWRTLLLVIAAAASNNAAAVGSRCLDSDDFTCRCERSDGRHPKVSLQRARKK